MIYIIVDHSADMYYTPKKEYHAIEHIPEPQRTQVMLLTAAYSEGTDRNGSVYIPSVGEMHKTHGDARENSYWFNLNYKYTRGG